ncbi:MAG: hypothetical protein HRT93_02900 [Piscirickettsiaceae bacterium]|nr:hypothetical protein [Piscirickettsiaceae bacterium]
MNLPAKASEGANNAHYLYCERHNDRRKYFVCLHTLRASKEGRLPPNGISASCETAADCGNCVADKMRREEVSKGEAIYFEQDPYHTNGGKSTIKDKLSQGFNAARRILGVPESKSPVRNARKSKPLKTTKPKKSETEFKTMDMGKLVTDMAKEEVEKEAKKKPTVKKKKNVPLPGESMLDMAKRLIKEGEMK